MRKIEQPAHCASRICLIRMSLKAYPRSMSSKTRLINLAVKKPRLLFLLTSCCKISETSSPVMISSRKSGSPCRFCPEVTKSSRVL